MRLAQYREPVQAYYNFFVHSAMALLFSFSSESITLLKQIFENKLFHLYSSCSRPQDSIILPRHNSPCATAATWHPKVRIVPSETVSCGATINNLLHFGWLHQSSVPAPAQQPEKSLLHFSLWSENRTISTRLFPATPAPTSISGLHCTHLLSARSSEIDPFSSLHGTLPWSKLTAGRKSPQRRQPHRAVAPSQSRFYLPVWHVTMWRPRHVPIKPCSFPSQTPIKATKEMASC